MTLDKARFWEIAEEHEMLVADGFDDCVLGFVYRFGGDGLIAYDYDKVIGKLMTRDGMTYHEAQEFWEFNIVGAYVGDTTPVYIETLEEE